MATSKEELVQKIECARQNLNRSIERGENYDSIYKNSVELDQLLELYIVSGF